MQGEHRELTILLPWPGCGRTIRTQRCTQYCSGSSQQPVLCPEAALLMSYAQTMGKARSDRETQSSTAYSRAVQFSNEPASSCLARPIRALRSTHCYYCICQSRKQHDKATCPATLQTPLSDTARARQHGTSSLAASVVTRGACTGERMRQHALVQRPARLPPLLAGSGH